MDPTVHIDQFGPLNIAGYTVAPMIWVSAVVAMVSLVTAVAAILFVGHRLRRAVVLDMPLPHLVGSDECTLVFLDKILLSASELGQKFIDDLPDSGPAWPRLLSAFGSDDPEFLHQMEMLHTTGEEFSALLSDKNGDTIRINGRPRGKLLSFRIQNMDKEQLTLHRMQEKLDEAQAEKRVFDGVLEQAPLMMWRRNESGLVTWNNARTAEVTGQSGIGWELPDVFRTDCDAEGNSSRRSSYRHVDTGQQLWYDVQEHADGNGEWVGYADNIDSLVQTEASLQRFISTLTETFAQLPVGLSIFDERRTLSLFNPALIDLLGIDPARLARRPSLREFFDILRDNRMVPGQKNFKDWRHYVNNIQERAQAGTLHEKLELPSGCTFEVTGNPHPHGAIALIFEDISPIITLEKRYRSEIELSQATLDRLTEAVAVFDTSGALVFANAAFSELWGFDPMEGLEPIRIVDATRRWGEQSVPTPVWGDLRDFATRSDGRAQWNADIDLTDGRRIRAGFSPLPDGSSLTVFSDITYEARTHANHQQQLADVENSESSRAAALTFALDRLREAVRDATYDESAVSGEMRNALSDALTQTDQILSLDAQPALLSGPQMGSLLRDLGNLAEKRGIELDVSMDEEIASMDVGDDLRRLLLNMVMAISDVLKFKSLAQMSIVAVDGGTAISCMGEARVENGDPGKVLASLPMRLLERIAQRLDGTMNIAEFGAAPNIKIACALPGLRVNPSSNGDESLEAG